MVETVQLDIARTYESTAPIIYSISDLHLGNSRPTNEATEGGFLDRAASWIFDISRTLVEGQFNQFDLVLNGDFFDLWAAIPTPRPDESVFDPRELGALFRRVRESVHLKDARYDELFAGILQIIAPWDYMRDEPMEASANVIYVVGNHDDDLAYTPNLRAVLFLELESRFERLMHLRGSGNPAHRQYISQQMALHFHLENYYWNEPLKTYVAHGHQSDHYNLRRKIDNGTPDGLIIDAQGRVIVESWINGYQDLVLNGMSFLWNRAFTAQNGINIRKALKLYNNFKDNGAAKDYVVQVSSNILSGLSGVTSDDLEEAIKRQLVSALWEAGDNGQGLAGNLRNAAKVLNLPFGEYVAAALRALARSANAVQAQKDLAQIWRVNGVPVRATTNKKFPKIVVVGHTHTKQFEPPASGNPVEWQFVNTGTSIDVREPGGLNPQSINETYPVIIQLDPAGSGNIEVVAKELGGAQTQRNLVVP